MPRGEVKDPFVWLEYPLVISPFTNGTELSAECGWLSVSNMPKPIPASARSRRTAIRMAARRSLVSVSARATTGSTLTRAERRRMIFVWVFGSVGGRHNRGFVVRGGSRMTGSGSGLEKLLARARGARGADGTDWGTMSSGSKKYMHLVNAVSRAMCRK